MLGAPLKLKFGLHGTFIVMWTNFGPLAPKIGDNLGFKWYHINFETLMDPFDPFNGPPVKILPSKVNLHLRPSLFILFTFCIDD